MVVIKLVVPEAITFNEITHFNAYASRRSGPSSFWSLLCPHIQCFHFQSHCLSFEKQLWLVYLFFLPDKNNFHIYPNKSNFANSNKLKITENSAYPKRFRKISMAARYFFSPNSPTCIYILQKQDTKKKKKKRKEEISVTKLLLLNSSFFLQTCFFERQRCLRTF